MKDYSHKVFTIPNILTMFRLVLIAPIMITFFNEYYLISLILIIISGLSDVIDGMIARKYNMISELGKILDPIADKLTQIVILFCLSFRQIYLVIPCGILVIKEVVSGIFGIMTVNKVKHMLTADWHGKLSTVFLYITLGAHMLMLIITKDIYFPVSIVLIIISSILITLSFILYLIRYKHYFNEIKQGRDI